MLNKWMNELILIFGEYIVLNSPISTAFKSILSQSKCSLEPKYFLRGLCPLNPLLRGSEPSASIMVVTLAFPLIMFAPGIISVFYLFPAGFYDIYPGHNKMAWD